MNLKKLLWPHVSEKEWNNWQWQLKNRLSGTAGLMRLGEALGTDVTGPLKAIKTYKWAATPYYLSLIKSKDVLHDPVGKQVIPSPKETEAPSLSLASSDPLREKEYSPIKGLIHRYRDRVVILATSLCASYCRHCNRKRQWAQPECITVSQKALEEIKGYLSSKPHVREVLVSGGDPLLLPLVKLEFILEALRTISTIKVIRLGTRVPVTLPMRVTDELCMLLKRHRPIWINTHFNHPDEITKEAKSAIERMQLAGIPVSNQSVLLQGVNDDYDTLHRLFCKLQEIMIRPYYLFQCDMVKGTNHFWVPLERGIEIMERMWAHVGGMCVPNFVVDLPDGGGKARLLPSHLLESDGGEAVFSTFEKRLIKVHLTHT